MQRPSDYEAIIGNDREFAKSDDLNKIKWVVDEQEDIYIPTYTDVLRVSFTHKFKRGKIADLVSLLSGRNFETRENLESIAQESFQLLREGVEAFVSETNFKRYLMIVRSTGIIDSSLVRSQNVLNFGYILYLSLKDMKVEAAVIETLVRRTTSIFSGKRRRQQMDKVKKWDEINGSGTNEEKMEAFLTDENDTYAILQLRYSDETAHERYVMLESLYSMKRCSLYK